MNISRASGLRWLTAAATCGVCAFSMGYSVQARGDDLKMSGCLVRAEGGAGYLLTNAPGEPSLYKADDHKIAPSAVGTRGGFATVFYWLYGNSDLDEHVGQRVEVEGDLQGDVRDGEIKTDRKDHWTEVEVKSDGRTMKARVPNSSIVADRDKRKGGILVRRVNVDKVKMIAAGCE